MARQLNTMQDIMAAFQNGEKDVREAVKFGVGRCLLIVAQEARNNVKATMKGVRPTGAGSSLLHSIGTGEYGVKRIKSSEAAIVGEVGTSLPHGIYLEFGTGVYGPKAARIYPKTAKVLAWREEAGSHYEEGVTASGKLGKHKVRDYNMRFARSVKGVPPWKWLSGAMNKVAPQMENILVKAVQEKIK